MMAGVSADNPDGLWRLVSTTSEQARRIHMPQQSRDQFVAEGARLGIAGRSISLLDPVFVVTAESRLQFTAFLNQEVDTKGRQKLC
jgi:hypothetical protein